MCGIAGTLGRDASAPADLESAEIMAAALFHRGPDDFGSQADGPCALAHRRLSILDLTPAGRQPIGNEDGSVLAAVNGEFYGFRGLRDDLIGRGHRFRSRSDSEVLVHLYEEEGTACLDKLDGLFAFALWDRKKQLLFCARDRFGKKPFYWRFGARGLVFASELQALRVAPDAVDDAVDLASVDTYLALQYVPAPRTGFTGIEKLPAGHLLVARPGERPEVSRYWRLSFATREEGVLPPRMSASTGAQVPVLRDDDGDEVLARGVRALLEDAVRARLAADVPLGAFLSGGLDSSAVVALLARLTGEAPRTFSVGFEGDASPELPFASLVARHIGARHEELVVRPDPERILPELARRYGEPFADASALPTYYLSQAARRHVTVALSGDGGDEIFGGYRRYLYARVGDGLVSLPAPLRALVAGLGRRLPGAPLVQARSFANLLGEDEATRYLALVGFASSTERRALYAKGAQCWALDDAHELFSRLLHKSEAAPGTNRLLDLDVQTYLADCILPKVDIASMAHALEVRSPLLDTRLAAAIAPLSARHKLRHGRGKRLLRLAVRDLLPAEILGRRKRGFDPPLARWLRGPLRPMVADALAGLAGRGLFNRTALFAIEGRHHAGDGGATNLLYALFMLELWWQAAVDRRHEYARAAAVKAREVRAELAARRARSASQT